MEINIGILIAQAVNFVIILVLFKVLVGDKLTKAITTRRAELAKAADASKIYEETIAEAEAAKKILIDEGVAHKNKLIEEAKIVASKKADEILSNAEKQAHHITHKAEERAEKLEDDLKKDFVDGVKKTTHIVVKKLFDKDVALQEQYVDELAREFANIQ